MHPNDSYVVYEFIPKIFLLLFRKKVVEAFFPPSSVLFGDFLHFKITDLLFSSSYSIDEAFQLAFILLTKCFSLDIFETMALLTLGRKLEVAF